MVETVEIGLGQGVGGGSGNAGGVTGSDGQSGGRGVAENKRSRITY